jgi:superfamily II DNA or RNA helicase
MELRLQQKKAIEVLSQANRGIIAMAPGSGKTLIQIHDSKRIFEQSEEPQTVVVVAPRILLASQLSFDYGKHINCAKYLHVHSKIGKVNHYHTTDKENIRQWCEIHKEHHKLIFTTYHSLKKIYKSGITVNTYMFDESHNSTSAGFHEYVKKVSDNNQRCFHFSGTPRFSRAPKNPKKTKKPGMNDPVYGEIIVKATAAEMIKHGYILKPRVISHYLEWVEERTAQHDATDILNIIKTYNLSKLLINVRKTSNMMEMLSETNFQESLRELGYDLLHITSNYGPVYNGKKIKRDRFFQLLDKLGESMDKKYVILNYSILGEGINIKSLDAVLLLRQLNLIKLIQTIGRAIRLSSEDQRAIDNGSLKACDYMNYLKPEGLVIIPVYDKRLLEQSKSITTTVEDVYEKGELPIMQV